MRTHEFEFKKTTKKVQKFKAISIDLTVEDAIQLNSWLLELFDFEEENESPSKEEELAGELCNALQKFLEKHVEPA